MTRTPVVFIHGAWLHALSWECWEDSFAGRGFLTCAPGWPGEAATAREARARSAPGPDIGLEALTTYFAEVVRSFEVPPVIIGHSVGGLVAQHLVGVELGQAAVAIAPVPINSIALEEGYQLVGGGPVDAPVLLSAERFREDFANAVSAEESDRLYERYVVPTPGRLLRDLGCGGGPRHPGVRVDTGNMTRGPLLLVSGQEDFLVPDRVTRAVYKEYGDSRALTELKQFADRGHSLVVDSGWQFIARYVLGWLDERGIRPTDLRR
ncbi:alpha/beta hydrolase [Streptacidiphilus jiangxiensis]|uniref:Lysophospholipase, alpha-beta hydrolase superfamily n=1 Tax=Streptacidiphilus jiangxiensis TaxID=235985 RepID=A0A1H7WG53_STRJI|nr:alpha/beta hydrolase [Streptacidiphilus jiangxiensis]SEM20536.1 Lysophospholipase, alpha-beta hydrolase superfamily [Streptacidiphilus jiangxiensis]